MLQYILQIQKNKESKHWNSFKPNKLNQTPNPNPQNHAKIAQKSLLVHLYFIENKIFSRYTVFIMRVGSDELIRTIRAEIFILRPSFYAIIDQHEIFDKKLTKFNYAQKFFI